MLVFLLGLLLSGHDVHVSGVLPRRLCLRRVPSKRRFWLLRRLLVLRGILHEMLRGRQPVLHIGLLCRRQDVLRHPGQQLRIQFRIRVQLLILGLVLVCVAFK